MPPRLKERVTLLREYARIEAIGIEHTLEMRNPPWA